MQRAPIDSAERLLCESCGYPLDGLDRAGACPECGLAVVESLPERRAGSPWQRRPGPGAWVRTLVGLASRPKTCWNQMMVEPRRAAGLLLANLAIGGSLATLALIEGPMIPTPLAAYVVAFWFASVVILAALTSIEFYGIRFWGRRHGFRISRDVALVVCGHASYAWLVSGAGLAASMQVAQHVPGLWQSRLVPGSWMPDVALLAIASVVPGIVLFSVLSGVGYFAMRWANGPHRAG